MIRKADNRPMEEKSSKTRATVRKLIDRTPFKATTVSGTRKITHEVRRFHMSRYSAISRTHPESMSVMAFQESFDRVCGWVG